MIDDPMWSRVQMWMFIKAVFERSDELFHDAARLRDSAQPSARPAAPSVPALYGKRRAALRESLDVASAALTAYVGARQAHQCLVAVVSLIDERERVALGALADDWGLAPLQRVLLDIDDGGDRVFDELAGALARPDTHGLVLEVYLLCLRSGFLGRYRDRRYDLDQAIAGLTERIRREQPRRVEVIAPAEVRARRARVALFPFPVRYYVLAAGVVLSLFGLLHVISNREVTHSDLAEYCHYGEDVPGADR